MELSGTSLVAPAPVSPSQVVVVAAAGLGGDSEQVADLPGGETDQLAAVLIMPRRCRGKLSTGAGAPFELR
jgi:hypothetical protein